MKFTKFFVTLLSFCAFAFAEEPLANDSLSEGEKSKTQMIIDDRSDLKIFTPALANQQMRKMQLENGMQILLISDPDSPQSGAALAVGVGSWDDPENRSGMAHFVEHMLFLGTEKFPEEEGYTRFLDEHGGSRNAFTMSDRTVYMFSVNNNGFKEALDRFGQFFIAPLFSPSGVDRECKAIHQEYCKNVPVDLWRVYYVKKELANPDHPFHSFCIGNSETLAQISQDELKEWYYNHYSSNLMRLVVISPLSLDAMEEEAVKIFSEVKNLNRAPSCCNHPLFSNENMAKMIAIAPVQELQMLEFTWELPRFYGQDQEIHADKLVSHVLGHEGSTSLLAQLKREQLAEGLGVSNFRAGKDQCLLSLTVHLTSKGVAEYEKVIQRCFEGIASLQQSGIPRFIFDEVQQIEELQYSYQSREDTFQLVTDYATRLIDEPLETFPRKGLIPSNYDPEKINHLLFSMKPEKCQFTLVAHPKATKTKLLKKERWLGAEYTLLSIPESKLEKWKAVKPHPDISIPYPNRFLPENLSIIEKKQHEVSFPAPKLIADTNAGKVWMATDDSFLVPEISWIFTLNTPQISDSNPKSHVLSDLYCHAVKERLATVTYQAQVAGLSYSLKTTHNGLELKVNGFSDKAPAFLQTILSEFKSLQPTKEEFALYQESARREYINASSSSPLKQGKELLWGLLYKNYPGLLEKEKALTLVSYNEFKNFCQDIWKESYVKGTLFGNIEESSAKDVWNHVTTALNSAPYPLKNHPKIELASLPNAKTPSYLIQKTFLPSNALILTADCGSHSFKARAAQEILSKGLEEPFFSDLRTRQQTAYIVFNWAQEIERHLYSFFAIQSSSHDPRDLLARFELFLESNLQNLSKETIPEERFQSIRAASIQKLGRPAETISSMGELLHTLAFDYDGQFDWLEKRIQGFKGLSYEEFLTYASSFLGKENQRRLAVMIEGNLPPNTQHITYRQIKKTDKIRQELSYSARDTVQERPL